ncbi:MAG: GxxExxY protein [Vicinamibacterales bacterium]
MRKRLWQKLPLGIRVWIEKISTAISTVRLRTREIKWHARCSIVGMEDQDPLTERIIGCAIEVHRQLGPGLLESAYQAALSVELAFNRLRFERERTIRIEYRGLEIGHYRPDLIVENAVVVEVKSVSGYDPVFTAQMLTYLRITGLKTGLLLNFNRAVLKDGIKRFVL